MVACDTKTFDSATSADNDKLDAPIGPIQRFARKFKQEG